MFHGRGVSLALGMLGLFAGIAAQLTVGAKLDAIGLFGLSLAAMVALITPVLATMPTRKNRIYRSPRYRRNMLLLSAAMLALGWLILIILAAANGIGIARAAFALALLSLTTGAWLINMRMGKPASLSH